MTDGTTPMARARRSLAGRPISLRDPADRILIARLLPRLTAVRMWLWMAGFSVARDRVASRLPSGPGTTPDLAALERAARAGRVAAGLGRRMPFDAACLVQSLALWWLLRRDGLPAELRIGVDKADGVFGAHAWVELMGEPVAETPAAVARFAPFERIGP